MSNGSMQFLGRQLSEQAKALSELVELMSDAVQGIYNSIEKYSIANDNIQNVIATNKTVNEIKDIKMKVMMTGSIRIKGDIKGYEGSASGLTINRNGVEVFKVTKSGGDLSLTPIVFDITIQENDEITFTDVTSGGAIVNLDVCYDLINKPNVSIV